MPYSLFISSLIDLLFCDSVIDFYFVITIRIIHINFYIYLPIFKLINYVLIVSMHAFQKLIFTIFHSLFLIFLISYFTSFYSAVLCLLLLLLLSRFSPVQLLVTPWTAAYQAPQLMGISRQEYWSGLPLPSPDSSFTMN